MLEGTTPAEAVVTSLLIDCLKLQAQRPLQVAALGDPAAYLPAQAVRDDLPAQLRVEMLGGPLRVAPVSDQVLVDVQTAEASVVSEGRNDFGVAFDPYTGDTTVAVYGGSVHLYSIWTGAPLGELLKGQQVTVSRGQVGEVTRISRSGRGLWIGLAVAGSMVALATLLQILALRSRARRHALPRFVES